jgi:hypothetical protein
VGDGDGTSVVVVGASLVPDEDGDGANDDAGCCDDVVGAPSEAEEKSPPPRVGASELLVPPGPVVDRLAATSTDLPDGQEGVTELAVAIPSPKLRRIVLSPSVPSSAWTWSSTCSMTSPATRPTASSGLAIGLSESGASHESSETATTAAATTPAPASA